MSIELLSLIGSLIIFAVFFLMASVLLFVLPRKHKIIAAYVYGIAFFFALPLLGIAFILWRFGL